jgi:TRAP-type transport system small permease protein
MTIETAPAPAASWSRRSLRGLDWMAGLAVTLAMAGMVAVVTAQVVLRYGLNESLDWADEVSRLLFVWSIFLAIPLGISRGSHVALELVTNRLPHGLRYRLLVLMNLLAIVLMLVVTWQATLLTMEQWDEPMSTLDVSVGVFMLPLCIGSAHSVLHLFAALWDGVAIKAPAVAK